MITLQNQPPATSKSPLSAADEPFAGGPVTGLRFLLYSHDSLGLGHLRRSLTIAAAFAETFRGASALVATGSPCATSFALPAGVEVLKLPSVAKDRRGVYRPRSLRASLADLLRLRAGLLLAAFEAFRPHLVVVDHQVIGLDGEALPLLHAARRSGAPTVLGLRDVIDAPSVVARSFSTPACRWALREGYDRICVYGSPEVYELRLTCPRPVELAARAELIGYVVHAASTARPSATGGSGRQQVLVTVGGGEDGARRLDAYLRVIEAGDTFWDTVLMTGPLLDEASASALEERAARAGIERVHRFHPDLPGMLRSAQTVVAMAGYNTCAEILDAGTPAVLLPRTVQRQEQLIRARHLERLGVARVVSLPDPAALRMAIEASLAEPPGPRPKVRLDGCRGLCAVAAELVATSALEQVSTPMTRSQLRRALP